MDKFEWSSEFEIGIPVIDKQHHELFVRIDALVLAIYKGAGKEQLDNIFDFLENYVEEHFAFEEELMLRYRYDDYPKHKEEHFRFIASMQGLKRDLERSGRDTYLAINTEKMLSAWWKSHILVTDRKYAPVVLEGLKRKP